MGQLAYHKILLALEVVWLPGKLIQLSNNHLYFILHAQNTSMKISFMYSKIFIDCLFEDRYFTTL